MSNHLKYINTINDIIRLYNEGQLYQSDPKFISSLDNTDNVDNIIESYKELEKELSLVHVDQLIQGSERYKLKKKWLKSVPQFKLEMC